MTNTTNSKTTTAHGLGVVGLCGSNAPRRAFATGDQLRAYEAAVGPCPECGGKIQGYCNGPGYYGDGTPRPATQSPRRGHDLSEGCGYDGIECTCSPAKLARIAAGDGAEARGVNENNQYGYAYGGDAD